MSKLVAWINTNDAQWGWGLELSLEYRDVDIEKIPDAHKAMELLKVTPPELAICASAIDSGNTRISGGGEHNRNKVAYELISEYRQRDVPTIVLFPGLGADERAPRYIGMGATVVGYHSSLQPHFMGAVRRHLSQ